MLGAVEYVTFALFEDQHANLVRALDRAHQLAGRSRLPRSALLDFIVTDFLLTNGFGSGDAELLTGYLARLEAATGKKLVLIDPATRTVEYGMDTLVNAAGGAHD